MGGEKDRQGKDVANEEAAKPLWPKIKFTSTKKSVKGEDFLVAETGLAWRLEQADEEDPGIWYDFFGVFDGHGGQSSANFCKSKLLQVFQEELSKLAGLDGESISELGMPKGSHDDDDGGSNKGFRSRDAWEIVLPKALQDAFLETNKQCCDHFEKSGTTASVLIVTRETDSGGKYDGRALVSCANVGDSYVYIDTGHSVLRFCEDHRVEHNKSEQERVRREGGVVQRCSSDGDDPLRIWPGGLMMSRTLGDRDAHQAIPMPAIRFSCLRITEEIGARIILASDGLWDAVNPKASCSLIRKKNTQVSCNLLVQSATKRAKKDRDDISIIVVDMVHSENLKSPFLNLETSTLSLKQQVQRERSQSDPFYIPVIWDPLTENTPKMLLSPPTSDHDIENDEKVGDDDQDTQAKNAFQSEDDLVAEAIRRSLQGNDNTEGEDDDWQPVKRRGKSVKKLDETQETSGAEAVNIVSMDDEEKSKSAQANKPPRKHKRLKEKKKAKDSPKVADKEFMVAPDQIPNVPNVHHHVNDEARDETAPPGPNASTVLEEGCTKANGKRKSKKNVPIDIYVGGIDRRIQRKTLKEYLQQFGKVSLFHVKFDRRARGYAFVSYADPSDVEKVLEVDEHNISGSKLVFRKFTPKAQAEQAPIECAEHEQTQNPAESAVAV